MHSLIGASYNCLTTLKLFPAVLPICFQVRWRKPIKRKPRYLPMASGKVFRIPQHPYVPEDEKQLNADLIEEYYRKLESLRKLFQDELKQKAINEEDILLQEKKQEEEFKLLLEENKKENERIRIIREEAMEQEFQQNLLQWLEMAEQSKQELEKTKLKVEEIVRMEKEKMKSYINYENIDQVIEKAIDNPVNINFTISVDGTIKWEGKPPLEYEADVNRRVAKARESKF